MGSIVTRQKARFCCSKEFANKLSSVFTDLGIDSKPDPNAYYTDTATFMDVIPECTNISAGGWHEHFVTEHVDIDYAERVMNVACKVKWEELPVEREIKDYQPKHKIIPRHRFNNQKVIKDVKNILNRYDLLHTNTLEYDTYNSDTLVFNTWFEDLNIKITILDDILLQIEGDEDITFELNELAELNLYLGNIFGIEIDTEDYDMAFYKGGEFDILGMEFDSVEDYLIHFDDINSDDTSYVVDKGGEQYKEYYGDVIPKQLVLKWFNDNVSK